MPDVLIRNFPAEDLVLLDARAAQLGISRSEFLRRQLHQAARRSVTSVTVADLETFSRDLPDLADPAIMTNAWQ